ncbi:enoyl-[acyl-carrier protein] reductase/trans-2-enoyl-CoA reductase (NAD+) [Treponema rectale]|uniref:Trans-2-enoyl-CoA reductase [NADH] n=1 Tax=Treponema rectale TaxID=744512 RepID=A0A840SDK5_9SPIR|nr:enoyl-ACP reductase FabV [Treponema rectale]MBB5218810.1 enoyl-[acyl-carrier protein] reductase/trans-2-enoyl-CoA reductase (NAD+) [Treponema rectale]
MAVIKPMIRSNICINAHPIGCAKETVNQINYVKSQKAKRGTKTLAEGGKGPKTVLVVGCSTGYGLASRISAAFEYGADTIGVSFEKEATQTKGGTPGWYNNLTFDREAKAAGLKTATFNADAFADETRATIINQIKEWNTKVDLIIYSLASPVRIDPDTKVLYKSVIKPIGQVYSGASLDMMTGKITQASTQPAEGDEIPNTVKVMGGEDWERWIKQLKEAGVLADGCRTIAYSYIGPSLSHAIYRDGTIGEAKKDLEKRAHNIDASLKEIGGAAYVSVNKGLITRSSSVIPIITQYLGVLFKVMKAKGTHEGCIEQMERLFAERLYTGADNSPAKVPVDSENRIRMDDWELAADVQAEIDRIMPTVTEENLEQTVDIAGIRHDFLAINGFDVEGVDYSADVADMSKID